MLDDIHAIWIHTEALVLATSQSNQGNTSVKVNFNNKQTRFPAVGNLVYITSATLKDWTDCMVKAVRAANHYVWPYIIFIHGSKETRKQLR